MPVTDTMPTAAKLVAAAGLGLVGWFASEAIRPLMPPETDFGVFNELNVLLGLVCGWRVIGTRVGGGISESIGIGLTGAAALVFWGLFFQSLNTMLDNALQRKYDGPFEGLVAIFKIGVEYGTVLVNGTVIGIIVIGGIGTGLVANWVHARNR